MHTVDLYMLRAFAKVLALSFASVVGVFIVFDAMGNFEEFVSYGKQAGGLFAVLADYYGARVPVFFDRMSSVLALMAGLFVATKLQRSNELTSLLAAGVPRTRIAAPIFVGALCVVVIAAANRELLIPQFRQNLSRNAQDWLGEVERPLRPLYDNRTDILLGGRATVANKLQIKEPKFRLPAEMISFGRQIAADDAFYHLSTEDRPGGYLLNAVRQPANIAEKPSLQSNGRDVILTPAETEWLEANQCFVVSDVSFEQLSSGEAWRRYSSTAQLIRAAHDPSLDVGANVRVTIHARIVRPLIDFALVLLGLPLALSRGDRNIFVVAGLGLVVVGAFWLLLIFCHAMGANYLMSPALAAWCPLMGLTPAAVFSAHQLWR